MTDNYIVRNPTRGSIFLYGCVIFDNFGRPLSKLSSIVYDHAAHLALLPCAELEVLLHRLYAFTTQDHEQERVIKYE